MQVHEFERPHTYSAAWTYPATALALRGLVRGRRFGQRRVRSKLFASSAAFKYPIQVGLATLQGEFNTDYGMLMTGAAVGGIPMMLVFFAFQRHFVERIRIGGVKG